MHFVSSEVYPSELIHTKFTTPMWSCGCHFLNPRPPITATCDVIISHGDPVIVVFRSRQVETNANKIHPRSLCTCIPRCQTPCSFSSAFIFMLRLQQMQVTKAPDESKASELVPCSLLPHWNSMRFFATVSLSDMNSLQEVKFATQHRQSSNTLRIL